MRDPAEHARQIIDANQYMTLGTADADGTPWASPVWFAHDEYTRFVWVSKPEARHSRNLAARARAALVVFDSTVEPGHGQAFYAEVEAAEVAEDEAERWIAVFSERSTANGARSWSVDDVRGPARLRLYLATASERYVLGPNDERLALSG